jgi:hypothetical protein
LCCRCFSRHAAITLYKKAQPNQNWFLVGRARGLLWSRRIVVAHTGKGNLDLATCVKV